MSPKSAKRASATVAAGTEGFQSAAMPSPFDPIDGYAFLSNCHTGALVAADGTVDWLCVPRFDSPSVFGALLDREAGAFRLGPFGINVPVSRAYEAGTNTLVTIWRTPTGWVEVRDALTMGRAEARTRSPRTPGPRPTTTPTTCWSARSAAWRARPRWSWSASPSSTTVAPWPTGPWWTGTGRRPTPAAPADGLSGKEGTFLICSFWLVSALAVVGEEDRARDLMEKLLRIGSPLGLFAEEFDVDTGHHLGNFPQAFSHLALIEAAGRIILAERTKELQG
jgi:GH15 family glucan-1,4-alpha-glucosidase